jgi:P27 family predicted phage terminase small subunit
LAERSTWEIPRLKFGQFSKLEILGRLPRASQRRRYGSVKRLRMSYPVIPTRLKVLRGNPGKRRINPEPEPPAIEVCPEPPAFLAGYAGEEWRRVAPALHVIGVLREVDMQILAGYCQNYAVWRTAVEALARVAAQDPVMHGLLIQAADGTPRRNPLVKVAADAANDMLRFANDLGIGPAARARIAAAGWEPPQNLGKFAGLLA